MKNYWKFLCLLPLLAACVSETKHNDDDKGDTPQHAFSGDSPENKGNALRVETRLDNPYYLSTGNKKEVYLYIEVHGTEAKSDKKRAPLNISLVLDKSGSMKGEKLRYAKQAMDFVIDQLSPEDMLSLVQYDDRVDVLSSANFVEDRVSLHRKVANIHENGSTNLCGGMKEGYVQVKAGKTDGYIRRNLLLSDGLANVGITDPQQIQHIAQKQFREEGIATSTFGLGLDYNEDLMTGISEAGGGNYYFIGSADKIPTIFAKELQSLLQVVAQSTQLHIHFPARNFKVSKVYGYPYTTQGDEVQIDLSDIFSQEEKTVLIKFEVTNPLEGDVDFESRISYTDAVSSDKGSLTNPLKLTFTQDRSLFSQNEDEKVKENRILFESTERMEAITKHVDDKNYEKARTERKELEDYMQTNAPATASPRYKTQQQQVGKYGKDIENYESMPVEEQKAVQKSTKSENYEMKKRK